MKKLILFVALIGLISCNKKQCWTCRYKTKKISPYGETNEKSSFEICDKTRSEINNIEGSGTYIDVINGVRYEITTKTNCNQGNPFK